MRRFICAALAALYLTIPALAVETLPEESFSLSCTAAVLMERQTGTVLYEKEAHRHLSPASVTKVMTLLLIMEALDDGRIGWDDMVQTSAAFFGDKDLYVYKEDKQEVHFSYNQLRDEVERFGTALNVLGIDEGRVAVIGETSAKVTVFTSSRFLFNVRLPLSRAKTSTRKSLTVTML